MPSSRFLLMLFSSWFMHLSLRFFACGHMTIKHKDIWFFAADIRLRCILLMFKTLRTCVKKYKESCFPNIRTHDNLKCPYFKMREDNNFKTCVLMLASMWPYVVNIMSLPITKCVLTYFMISPHAYLYMSSWLLVYVPMVVLICPYGCINLSSRFLSYVLM